MMMHCLSCGGMDVAKSESRDSIADQHADAHYHPNASGLWEIPLQEYGKPGWPRQYDGKLIKIMAWGLRQMAAHRYKVVLMQRDPEEIRQSYEAFLGRPHGGPWDLSKYQDHMQETQREMESRKDVDFLILDYADVVSDPMRAMSNLAACGWPINAKESAKHVDSKQYRFRRELLTVGI